MLCRHSATRSLSLSSSRSTQCSCRDQDGLGLMTRYGFPFDPICFLGKKQPSSCLRDPPLRSPFQNLVLYNSFYVADWSRRGYLLAAIQEQASAESQAQLQEYLHDQDGFSAADVEVDERDLGMYCQQV